MQTRFVGGLAATLFLAACTTPTVTVPAASQPAAASSASRAIAPPPAAPPAFLPNPEARVGVTANASTPANGNVPTVPSNLLKGTVALDPAYIVASGAGNIIASGTGNIIASGAGNIIASGMGNIIASGSGNIIASGANNLTGSAATSYRLLDAGAASVPGQLLPVSGMLITAVSLSSGLAIGRPVITDDRGNYQLNVPKSLSDKNIMLVGQMPGKPDDRRLQYTLAVSPTVASSQAFDEDTSLVTRYIRESFRSKFLFVLTPANIARAQSNAPGLFRGNIPPQVLDLITQLCADLGNTVQASNITPDRLPGLGRATADMMLSSLDVSNAITFASNGAAAYAGKPVIPVLADLNRRMRNTIAQNGLSHYTSAAYFQAANSPTPTYELRRTGDVSDFIMQRYLSSDAQAFALGRSSGAFADVGMTASDIQMLTEAGDVIISSMFVSFLTSPDFKQRVLDAIKGYH